MTLCSNEQLTCPKGPKGIFEGVIRSFLRGKLTFLRLYRGLFGVAEDFYSSIANTIIVSSMIWKSFMYCLMLELSTLFALSLCAVWSEI